MAIDRVVITAPVSVKETVALDRDYSPNPQILHQITLPTPLLLDGTTSPPATKIYADKLALTGGAKTINLRSLANGNLPDFTFLNLKVQVFVFSCPISNTGVITMTPGTNDYDMGGASMSLACSPGGTIVLLFDDNSPTVVDNDKHLDFAGTGSETFDLLIVAG